MRLRLLAVGKLKSQEPEQVLTVDWIARANRLGPSVGFSAVTLTEIAPKLPHPDPDREAAALLNGIGNSTQVVSLDERGSSFTSRQLAKLLADWRDAGRPEVVVAIGGPDGHGTAVRHRADQSICFGVSTWPHKLVRAMAAEQLYRALTILGNLPYHRD